MTPLIKPPKLNPGDKVATITLSWGGAGTYLWRYEAGVSQLKELLNVDVAPTRHSMRDADWIKNNPQARADDLMEAFSDPEIKAIISNIGGEDSIRILPHLDLETISQNPKIFMGYSDSTITHFACLNAGLSSFYGPAIMAGFAENGGLFPYTSNSVKKTLCQTDELGEFAPSQSQWTYKQNPWEDPENQNKPREMNDAIAPNFLQGTKAVQGRLIGGCLEVLEFLKGTNLWPSQEEWDDTILFIETSEEGPDPDLVKRWLRNYAAQGVFDRTRGILFGRPGGVEADQFDAYDDALRQVVSDEYGFIDMPIVTKLDFGHTDPMGVMSFGILTEIDPINKKIKFLESAVV